MVLVAFRGGAEGEGDRAKREPAACQSCRIGRRVHDTSVLKDIELHEHRIQLACQWRRRRRQLLGRAPTRPEAANDAPKCTRGCARWPCPGGAA